MRHFFGTTLVAFACLAPPGCGPAPAADGPSILLVTLDTTRADRIGAYGYEEAETPTLDALAEQGVLFENAIAPAPITLPTHATLLTGVYPPAHGVRDNGQFALSKEATLLSEVLQQRGWRTGAFVGAYVLDSRFGLDQGFDTYDAPKFAAGTRSLGAARPANHVVDAASEWLESLDPGERFLLWVHLYDPHAPYLPPEPFASRHEDPYDGEIAFVDAQLGRLLESYAGLGRQSDLITVVTSDHGEAFGEHEETTHAMFVYQTTLRVPLLLSGGALESFRGTRVAQPVSLAALAPTLLDLGGLAPELLPAAKLAPLLSGETRLASAQPDVPIYFESYHPFYTMRWHGLRGLVWQGHKLVLGRTAELFRLADDPGELSDLAGSEQDRVTLMRGELERLESEQRDLGWGSTHDPGPEEIARLESLGYTSTFTEGDPLDPSLPDPRHRLVEWTRYNEADRLWERGRALELRARSAASPEEREALREQARAQWIEARRVVESIETGEQNPLILDVLGKIEFTLGRPEQAAVALERSVALQPRVATAHYNLGLAYRVLERGDLAARSFEKAYELEPRQPRFAVLVAKQLADNGDLEGARRWLPRARESVQPGTSHERALQRLEEELAKADPGS